MFAVLSLLFISTISGYHGKIAQYTVDLAKLEHEPYLSLHTAIDDNLGELCGALIQWDPNDAGSYDAIKAIGAKIANTYGYRTTLCVPDGSVVYDAPKGADNTFENAVNKVIDENHNTRVSIMSAQLNDEGKAWEEKLSTSSSTVENYVSERCGDQTENFGTVRLSAVADNNGGKIAHYTVDLSKLEHEPYRSLNMAVDANFDALCGALEDWDPSDKGSYTAIKAIGAKITNKYGYRTTLCVPDGSVVYDAPKGADNTFENAVNKAIDENHNTRVSIMSAQLNDEGKAWEEKLSTSSSTVENYVSTRCGGQSENSGTVRLSAVADQ